MKATKTRFQTRYEKEIRAALKQKHGYKNDFQIPQLEKIVLKRKPALQAVILVNLLNAALDTDFLIQNNVIHTLWNLPLRNPSANTSARSSLSF